MNQISSHNITSKISGANLGKDHSSQDTNITVLELLLEKISKFRKINFLKTLKNKTVNNGLEENFLRIIPIWSDT